MISLRKINSLLIVILVLMLAYHALLATLYFLGIVSYMPDFKITGRRLFYPLVLHIIISLYLYIREKSKSKRYSNLIKETNQQMITGICIIIFAALHILNYSWGSVSDNTEIFATLSHIIVDNLLFVSIALHLRVSLPRLLISFGFLEGKDDYTKAKSKINTIVFVLLVIIFMAEAIFYIGGIL